MYFKVAIYGCNKFINNKCICNKGVLFGTIIIIAKLAQ